MSSLVSSWEESQDWSLLGVGNGNPLQYCCLGKSVDRGGWQGTAHGVAKSRHNWAAEHKQGPTLIQTELISKSTVTCTKIVFPNQVLFVGSGGYNLGIPLGLLLNLLQSGKKKKKVSDHLWLNKYHSQIQHCRQGTGYLINIFNVLVKRRWFLLNQSQ